MKLWQLLLGLGVILVFVAFLGAAVRIGPDAAELTETSPLPPAEPPVDPTKLSESWGASPSRVMLQAFLPRGNKTAERVVRAFRAVVAAHRESVRAEVLDMRQPAALAQLEHRGIRMPFVAVNGKTRFRVRVRGRSQDVLLQDVGQLKALPLEDVLNQIVEQQLKERERQDVAKRGK
jgi:hypothetical protein